MRPAAIVIGADDVGSAVAVMLDRAGYATILSDEVDPPWARRGMAFTDAWYVGNASLADTTAVFCSTVKSIPTVLDRRRMIAATTWSWRGVASALPVVVIVDASPAGGGERDLRAFARADVVTIRVGRRLGAQARAEIAIDPVEYGAARGGGAGVGHAAGEGRASVEGCAEIGIVRAPVAGRFATSRRIGDLVRAGDVVGLLENVPAVAPCAGALLGLAARGGWVPPGVAIVEVDPAGDAAACFGLAPPAVAVGRAVVAVLEARLRAAAPVSEPAAT
jgi:xanthine dehydrogenase accessory factor